MLTVDSVRWYCPNRDCNRRLITSATKGGNPIPRCVCGGEMKRADMPVLFHYLDFLYENAAIQNAVRAGQK